MAAAFRIARYSAAKLFGFCLMKSAGAANEQQGWPSQISRERMWMKPSSSIHRALVHRVGAEEAVDVAGAQVGHHLGRRHHAQLHVGIRVDAVLGEVVAQEQVVDRELERDGELEALPVLRVAVALVLVGQHDGLAVDVLDGHHVGRRRVRADAHRDGDRHRRQHVRWPRIPCSAPCRGSAPSRRS
jgi:hypothetical protein